MVIDDEEPHIKRTYEPYAKLSEIAKANPQKKVAHKQQSCKRRGG